MHMPRRYLVSSRERFVTKATIKVSFQLNNECFVGVLIIISALIGIQETNDNNPDHNLLECRNHSSAVAEI